MTTHTPSLRLVIVGDTLYTLDSDNKPASRIEWLQKFQRVYIVNACNAYDANQALIAEQSAEIERLREALRVIKLDAMSLDSCVNIAREALQVQEVEK